jgi:hypothetical protein
MRTNLDAARLERLLRALGDAARGPGRVYLTGGTSAVAAGWRASTIDADLKLEPEPPGVLSAIARLKDELDVNVELASPDLFIPTLPGWQERSVFIARHGHVDFFHYDFHAQALAKIERGHARDLLDVTAMAARGLIRASELARLFDAIAPDLERFPAIDPDVFRARLEDTLRGLPDPVQEVS